MKTEKRQKIVDYKVFIAKDNTVFDSEYECEYHERNLNNQPVWVLTEKSRSGDEFLGVFSTKEKAQKWIDNLNIDAQGRFKIVADYIDSRVIG